MVLLFVYFFLDVNTLLGLKKTQKYFKYWSKQYFFRGCEHPKVIRELTPSWDILGGFSCDILSSFSWDILGGFSLDILGGFVLC